MGWLLAGVGVLCVMHLVLHGNSAWFDTMPVGVGRWLDMNSESSVSTWYNVSLLALAAAMAALAAIATPEPRQRLAWGVLAALVLLLSIDEKVQVHEQLPELFGMSRGAAVTHEWLLPGVIIAGLGVAVLAYLVTALDRLVRRGLLLALLVYAAGTLVVEGLSGIAVRELAPEHPIRAAMPLWEAIEESLEMLGCIVALSVILEHLQRRGVLVVRRGQAADPPAAPSDTG